MPDWKSIIYDVQATPHCYPTDTQHLERRLRQGTLLWWQACKEIHRKQLTSISLRFPQGCHSTKVKTITPGFWSRQLWKLRCIKPFRYVLGPSKQFMMKLFCCFFYPQFPMKEKSLKDICATGTFSLEIHLLLVSDAVSLCLPSTIWVK